MPWATWHLFTAVPLVAVCFMSGLLGHLSSVHRCARPRSCVVCAVSLATWLVFTVVPARCVVLRVWSPRPLKICSLVCLPFVFCCVCSVLGHLAHVHRCATRCSVFRVWSPGPLGFCSPVCPPEVLCCVCGLLGHLAPVHRCARSVRCVGCVVSSAT